MNYPLPAAALDDRLGFVGTAGSGKTYNAGAGVELILARGGRVIIPDPLGVWWGLALRADGKTPSTWRDQCKLVIFGGEHGDLPINEQAGALIGETVATMAESAIIDLSGFGTKAAEVRFMLAFLTALYRHASVEPVHLVFDEADMWAPQQERDKGEAPKLLGMMETVVRRGRVRGFIPWLITQRPAVLNKNVLSMVDGLVAFKLTSSQDRVAIGAWIEGQADREEGKRILGSLPTMQRGQGVVWVPARGILETSTFPPKSTFDSSKTPERGASKERRDLKPVNLERLKGKLAAIEEDVKENDPKALKAEVARLQRELVKAQRAAIAPLAAPPPVVANADEIDEARKDGERVGISIGITRAQQALAALRVDEVASPAVGKIRSGQDGARAAVRRTPPLSEAAAHQNGITGPQQRILNALAWWKVFGHDAPSNEQVAFIAGYSATSTGYTNPRGALKMAGLVTYPSPGNVSLTDAGADKAEAPDAAPTGEELRRRVMAKLSGPQQRILAALIEAHPEALTNEAVAERAGYSHTSTGYTNPRGSLKTLSLIDYPQPGWARAQDWLFP